MLVSLNQKDLRMVHTPPLLCIEILSSEDRLGRIRERLADYASLGVKTIWVVDPWRRTAHSAGPDAILRESTNSLSVLDTEIAITVPAIWAELDRLERRAAARSPTE